MTLTRTDTAGALTGAMISAAFAAAWAMWGASGLSGGAAVVIRVVAVVAGLALLARVGAHFLLFGRAFWTGFYVIGAVFIGGALAGALIGLAGGSAADIRAVTGLTAAVGLFLASARTVLRIGPPRPFD